MSECAPYHALSGLTLIPHREGEKVHNCARGGAYKVGKRQRHGMFPPGWIERVHREAC